MRIRLLFAAAFLLIVLAAAYLDLSTVQIPQINDKALHFMTFFVLTITFYWIVDTTRRRTLNFTLLIVTVGLGLGSECLQSILPNGRSLDPVVIGANVLGSIAALGICTLYHKRMLDRRRRKKGYGIIPQDGEAEDIELGDGVAREVQSGDGIEGDEAWDDMGGEGSPEGENRLTPNREDAGDDIADARK